MANRYPAVLSNSAVRFGHLVVYFQPSGFYLFGRPVSAVSARPIQIDKYTTIWGTRKSFPLSLKQGKLNSLNLATSIIFSSIKFSEYQVDILEKEILF